MARKNKRKAFIFITAKIRNLYPEKDRFNYNGVAFQKLLINQSPEPDEGLFFEDESGSTTRCTARVAAIEAVMGATTTPA